MHLVGLSDLCVGVCIVFCSYFHIRCCLHDLALSFLNDIQKPIWFSFSLLSTQVTTPCSPSPQMRRCLREAQLRWPAGWLRMTTRLCSGPTQHSRLCILERREVKGWHKRMCWLKKLHVAFKLWTCWTCFTESILLAFLRMGRFNLCRTNINLYWKAHFMAQQDCTKSI